MGFGIGGSQAGYQTFRQGMSDLSGAIVDRKSKQRMAGAAQEAFKIMQDPNHKPTPQEMQDWAGRWQLSPQEVATVAYSMKMFRSLLEPEKEQNPLIPVEIGGKSYNLPSDQAYRYMPGEGKPVANISIDGQSVPVEVDTPDKALKLRDLVSSLNAEKTYPTIPTRPRARGESDLGYAETELDTLNRNISNMLGIGAKEDYNPRLASFISEKGAVGDRIGRIQKEQDRLASSKKDEKPEYEPGEAMEKIGNLRKERATLEKSDSVTEALAAQFPQLSGMLGQQIPPDLKSQLMRSRDRQIAYLQGFIPTKWRTADELLFGKSPGRYSVDNQEVKWDGYKVIE